MRGCLSPRQLDFWRKRYHKIGNARADNRAILQVAASAATSELGSLLEQFVNDPQDTFIDEEEFDRIREEARRENAEARAGEAKNKENRTL